MKISNSLPIEIIMLYSILVVIWWACVWGIFEEIIHRVSNKNPFNKVLLYSFGIFIIIVLVYRMPQLLEHF
jgi:threonine/homoserine/homoserine lactone efflux protein